MTRRESNSNLSVKSQISLVLNTGLFRTRRIHVVAHALQNMELKREAKELPIVIAEVILKYGT